MQITGKHRYLMDVAHLTAFYSKCSRMGVGCVIADENLEVFTVGCNGGPKGGRDGCARNEVGNCGCLHAEMNAITKSTITGPKAAFLTLSPCEQCAQLLRNADVRHVFYATQYRDRTGIDLLLRLGVSCTLIPGNEYMEGFKREST